MAEDQPDSAGEQTTDHALVRAWMEDHDAYPAHLDQSEGEGDRGLLRVGFREGEADRDLKEIRYEEFFEEFEEKDLAFVYPDEDPRETDDPPSLLRKRER